MAFDLEEQEQMDNLKAFWERWGTFISTLVIGGALAFAAWKGYGIYQAKQGEKAAAAYESYIQAVQKKDAGADAALAAVQQNFTKTHYAALASFNAAQAAIADKQWDKAQIPLQWVLTNGAIENQGAARLMLADVLVEAGKADEALKTLETLPSPNFALPFENKKSDVYLQKNDVPKARAALESAIKIAKEQGATGKEMVQALQGKLDILPKVQ